MTLTLPSPWARPRRVRRHPGREPARRGSDGRCVNALVVVVIVVVVIFVVVVVGTEAAPACDRRAPPTSSVAAARAADKEAADTKHSKAEAQKCRRVDVSLQHSVLGRARCRKELHPGHRTALHRLAHSAGQRRRRCCRGEAEPRRRRRWGRRWRLRRRWWRWRWRWRWATQDGGVLLTGWHLFLAQLVLALRVDTGLPAKLCLARLPALIGVGSAVWWAPCARILGRVEPRAQ